MESGTRNYTIRFRESGESKKEKIGSDCVSGALMVFAGFHPRLGPEHIEFVAFTNGGRTVHSLRSEIERSYQMIPYPTPYQPLDYSRFADEGLHISCPRCGSDIGEELATLFSPKTITADLDLCSLMFTCFGCGSDIGNWVRQYFNSATQVFRTCFGMTGDGYVERFVSFHRQAQILLQHYQKQFPAQFVILDALYGLSGTRRSLKQIAKDASSQEEHIQNIHHKGLRGLQRDSGVTCKLLLGMPVTRLGDRDIEGLVELLRPKLEHLGYHITRT